MTAKDGRSNARTKDQRWELMSYIDQISFEAYLESQARGRFTAYLFSGDATIGNIRVDFRKESNANLIMDVFQFLDQVKDNTFDVVILDPLFHIYYNPNIDVWEKAIRDGIIPDTIRSSQYFGHNNEWQRAAYNKVKPGGILISKRDIRNTNVLSENPQLFYVHDARPMAYIVRIDHK